MRNRGSGWLRNEVTRNPWVWGAVALCLVLVFLAAHWSPLAGVLSVESPGLDGWALAFSASLVPLVAGQLTLLPRFARTF
jgi:Ca2+-transporting ATPase